MTLIEWMKLYREKKSGCSASLIEHIDLTTRLLCQYGDCRLRDAGKAYCLGFIDFLKKAKTKQGKPLSAATAKVFQDCLRAALNEAVREEMIERNPFVLINHTERIKKEEQMMIYLTIEEVKRLRATECRDGMVKRAYLFSVFCGLRISDVRALRWRDININGGQTWVTLRQKKTGDPLWLPLSKQAVECLPERCETGSEECVFKLPSRYTLNQIIGEWAKEAGIDKHVTFHSSRHTHATMMLTLGADLYTVSKLLGHSNINTTQIYARIIDQTKVSAVNKIDLEFGESNGEA